MPYKALDENSIPDYVKNRPALDGLFPPDCNVGVKEIGDGNVNLVFIVENKDNRDQ